MPKPIAVGGDVTSVFLNDLTGVYERDTTENDIVNSAGEGTLFSEVIAAGDMSTNRMLRLLIVGDYLNNTGTTQELTLRVKFGGTTLFGDGILIATSTARRIFTVQLQILNLGAANSNFLNGLWTMAQDGAGSVAGRGDLEAAQGAAGALTSGAMRVAPFGADLSTIDTTVAQTLAATAQHGAASASLSMRKRGAVLELL